MIVLASYSTGSNNASTNRLHKIFSKLDQCEFSFWLQSRVEIFSHIRFLNSYLFYAVIYTCFSFEISRLTYKYFQSYDSWNDEEYEDD